MHYFWWKVPYRQERFDSVAVLPYGVVLALAVIGIVLCWRSAAVDWPCNSLVLLVLLSYPLVFYFTRVDFYRYRFPIEVFLRRAPGSGALRRCALRIPGSSSTA